MMLNFLQNTYHTAMKIAREIKTQKEILFPLKRLDKSTGHDNW